MDSTLVRTLNSSLGEKSIKERTLELAFETYWPQFEVSFNRILVDTENTGNAPVEREEQDMLAEILTATRTIDKRLRKLENDSLTRDPKPTIVESSLYSQATETSNIPLLSYRSFKEHLLTISLNAQQLINQGNNPESVSEMLRRTKSGKAIGIDKIKEIVANTVKEEENLDS